MNKKHRVLTALICLLQFVAHAQEDNSRCGTDDLRRYCRAVPDAARKADSIMQAIIAKTNSFYEERPGQNKTHVTIPVIFHIVLNSAQIDRLGGLAGIAERIDSQMAVVNRDFNAEYPDSIPGSFNVLRGSAGIRFALARRSPTGAATRGFEIVYTDRPGFREGSNSWSGRAYAEVKNLNGTITAWDPEQYLNVWVINPINASGSTSATLGICVPPSFLQMGIPGLSKYELGIVLNYGAFGKTRNTAFFVDNVDGGRTLTHELGHYFELIHIWGDDNGACTAPLGKDDGIADTPPQAGPSTGCPTFPLYDNCSSAGDGVMFMNFMDYTADACMRLFTKQQVAFMNVALSPGNFSYALTTHPEVLQDPTGVADAKGEDIAIYPNPAATIVNIAGIPQGKYALRLYDALGRLVYEEDAVATRRAIAVNVSRLAPAMYTVVLRHNKGYYRANVWVQ